MIEELKFFINSCKSLLLRSLDLDEEENSKTTASAKGSKPQGCNDFGVFKKSTATLCELIFRIEDIGIFSDLKKRSNSINQDL